VGGFSLRQFPCTLGPAGVPTMPGDPPAPSGRILGTVGWRGLGCASFIQLDGMRSDCPLVAPGSAVSPAPLPLAEPSEAARAPVARERAMAARHISVCSYGISNVRGARGTRSSSVSPTLRDMRIYYRHRAHQETNPAPCPRVIVGRSGARTSLPGTNAHKERCRRERWSAP
jgi:hypothetical protein